MEFFNMMLALAGGGSGGSGGAQPNWNAKEGEAGHIANRTHWVDYNEKTIVGPITFDGDLTTKERVIVEGSGGIEVGYFKMSNCTPEPSELIGKTLNMPDEEVYMIWENRVKQVMESAGMNVYSNSGLINTMFDCAKKYLMKGVF